MLILLWFGVALDSVSTFDNESSLYFQLYSLKLPSKSIRISPLISIHKIVSAYEQIKLSANVQIASLLIFLDFSCINWKLPTKLYFSLVPKSIKPHSEYKNHPLSSKKFLA